MGIIALRLNDNIKILDLRDFRNVRVRSLADPLHRKTTLKKKSFMVSRIVLRIHSKETFIENKNL